VRRKSDGSKESLWRRPEKIGQHYSPSHIGKKKKTGPPPIVKKGRDITQRRGTHAGKEKGEYVRSSKQRVLLKKGQVSVYPIGETRKNNPTYLCRERGGRHTREELF